MKDITPNDLGLNELKEWIVNVHEKDYIELKKGSELPKSFWDSYSSFCNTSGGWIILGVEEGYPKNIITGVGNPQKTLTSLWDQASNTSKVSFRNIVNQDVHEYNIDGKAVIIIRVKEVADTQKPVYLDDKIEKAYIRTGDGDRKITKEELEIFLRNAQPGQDILPAENYTLEDLDMDSLISFKEKVGKRYPGKKYTGMEYLQFLTEIGACVKDRETGTIKLKRGTILFLGKVNAIKELFPHYHVDYFNHRGDNPRWSDRVTDDEPSDYEMNLYNFYSIVYEKMKALLSNSFKLDDTQTRLPISDFDETIRECIVNCLAHADYVQGYPSTKIDAYDGWFRFINPGKMLVSKEQFITGGDSRPRNEIIMSMFRLLGASERQGFGGPMIYKSAAQNDFRMPEVTTDINHTELKIWNIDLADAYPELADNEKRILQVLTKSNMPISIRGMGKQLNLSEYAARKSISRLEQENLVQKIGTGPATKYTIKRDSTYIVTQLQMIMDQVKQNLL